MAEDTDITRADETGGFIVLESGHGTISGVEYEALVGADTVRGTTNSPPYTYTFSSAFASTPTVAITSLAGLDGGDGGWAQTYGSTPMTASTLDLTTDEDQISNTERNHTPEQVAYVVFASAVAAQTQQLKGDLNYDGQVNPLDLEILIDAWGPCAANCPADLDGDGLVGVADLVEMIGMGS